MARAHGARSQMAVAFETTYGTPPVSGFLQMPFVSSTLGSEQPLMASDLLGQGRDPRAPTKDVVTADGNLVVPVDPEGWGVWLKGAFGAPITTGAGPYTHEFRSGSWNLPSMSIEVGMPDVPHFSMFAGSMVNSIQWTMQRGGQLTATVALVAQGEVVDDATAAGTPTAIADLRFGHFNGSIKRDGVALASVVSTQITYANNLDPVGTIRPDGKIDGADAGLAALTGQTVVRFADQTLLNQALAGEACELEFEHVLVSGESFTLTIHAVYLPKPRIEIPGPQGIQVTFDWQAAKATSPARMCTAVLVNDKATY